MSTLDLEYYVPNLDDYFDQDKHNENTERTKANLEFLKNTDTSQQEQITEHETKLESQDTQLEDHGTRLTTQEAKSVSLQSVLDAVPDTYSVKEHNHSGVYEPVISTKNSGFNLNKSDSVSSASTSQLATSKAVKTAYDKGASALSVANTKAASNHDHSGVYEPAISKKSGFNLEKSDSVTSTSTSVLATSKAAKVAYDKGVEALNTANAKAATGHNHDSTYLGISATAARAIKADYWTTAKTLTLSGDVTGSVSVKGNTNMTLNTAVKDDSHNHGSTANTSYDVEMSKYLRWKNYGNNHVIIDASAGTAPNGTAIDKSNSEIAWQNAYPTLMGWNGYKTYGVRVDSARLADSSDCWTTARTLYLAGDLTGSVSIRGNENITLSASVKNNSHEHTIFNYLRYANSGFYIGYGSGLHKLSGTLNFCFGGYQSLGYNGGGTGARNCAGGYRSLYSLTSGNANVALGHNAGQSITTGENNTLIGISSGENLKTGTCNTFVGSYAGFDNDYSNVTAIGHLSNPTGSNQVQLGNSSTTVYAYGAVQNRSDKRDKTNIQKEYLGIEFINKLNPVVFQWEPREDYVERITEKDEEGNIIITEIIQHEKDGSKVRTRQHHGLIAQEVKAVADELEIDFAGYQDHALTGGEDVKSLGYQEFTAPIIKALQDLSKKVDALEAKLKALEAKLATA